MNDHELLGHVGLTGDEAKRILLWILFQQGVDLCPLYVYDAFIEEVERDFEISVRRFKSESGAQGFACKMMPKESPVSEHVWKKARKTAIAEFREATEEDEDMIRKREGETILRSFGIGLGQPAWPHYLIMRGSHVEEYPIARFSFGQTYEVVEG